MSALDWLIWWKTPPAPEPVANPTAKKFTLVSTDGEFLKAYRGKTGAGTFNTLPCFFTYKRGSVTITLKETA
jgi:hypothetical protein